MAVSPVADDEVAAIVTTLEMTARPPLRPLPTSHLRLLAWPQPTPARYRALFIRVGGPWLWYSRLAMDDAALLAIVGDPAVQVFAAVDPAGIEIGMLELDFRQVGHGPGICTLAYLALVPELTGQGHGRWLMAQAMARAWVPGVTRVVVHTCTLDHPHALGFYRASGFRAVRRTTETFPDPRVIGLLPADAAPQIPLLASAR